jgi:hypothetical protein
MVDQQVYEHAASLELLRNVPGTISITLSGLEQYYNAHTSDYDKVCISIAVVSLGDQAAFVADANAGASVATLVHEYSQDATSAAKDGAYGCYAPGDSAYATVRKLTGSAPLNTFGTTPQETPYNGQTVLLYVAPTSRTPTSLYLIALHGRRRRARLQRSDRSGRPSIDPERGPPERRPGLRSTR